MNKKDDIIQAAERLFYINGFHATSTDRICSEAGVSTRTLYRYFPSREVLTEAVLATRQERFFAALLPPEHSEAITRLFEVQSEWMQENGPLGCLFLKAWGEYAEEDRHLAALALDYRYRQREYISSCLRHSAGEALSDAVWMLFEGAITSALILGPQAAIYAGEAAKKLLATCGQKQ